MANESDSEGINHPKYTRDIGVKRVYRVKIDPNPVLKPKDKSTQPPF